MHWEAYQEIGQQHVLKLPIQEIYLEGTHLLQVESQTVGLTISLILTEQALVHQVWIYYLENLGCLIYECW